MALLLARHPPLDARDASFDGTPLWVLHGWREAVEKEPYYDVVARLAAAGAPVGPEWLSEGRWSDDPRTRAALDMLF